MPVSFAEICTLFSRLEDIESSDPPIILPNDRLSQVKAVTESWFKSHRQQINALNIDETVALLSACLPERRTDRVYGVQSPGLCRILCRGLGLRSDRANDLRGYERPGAGDLAACLERVLQTGGPPAMPSVTLGEVDEMLNVLAGGCRFSDQSLRLPPDSSEARNTLVGNIVKRLEPSQGKWLVRLILKNLSPLRTNEHMILTSYHFLLPDLLRFQNCFKAAISLLKGELKEYPEHPDARSHRLHRQRVASLLTPSIGIKVGRPTFFKARSIDGCISMLGKNRWILERKYDGEYCEIHIDLSRSSQLVECITIFSKSGKDSTIDRQGLHQPLVDCLRLGQPDCKIKRYAILLGELVVYSDDKRCVLSFDQIRKHVYRSGRSLGTKEDSPPHPDEHLAIVFFDLLLLDDEIVMRRPLDERRVRLRDIYTKIGGRAWSAEWKIVDFKDPGYAKKLLVQQFAASIAERCEGLILKPCEAPFFNLEHEINDHINGYIKLKKDYIAGMGDEADFAVIGARYDSQQALKSDVEDIKWTDFHLGCLLNKVDVLRLDARPRYKVVATIQVEHCIPRLILDAVNILGNFSAKTYSGDTSLTNFDVEHDATLKISTVFDSPFVFEVLGSGFEKPSNCNFYMLRHPRVKKLHQDRTWRDCISMQELQEQAKSARGAPVGSESQETRKLIEKLKTKCKKKFERARTATPGSGSTRVLRSSERTVRSVGTISAGSCVELDNTAAALDGSTLIDSSSARKRRREDRETPCPVAKKARTELTEAENHEAQSSIAGIGPGKAAPSPLAEIMNDATRLPTRIVQATKLKPNTHSKTRLLSRISNFMRPSLALITSTSNSEIGHCTNSTCPFANTVVYLSPCIAHTPWIAIDLLRRSHDVITVPTLTHWDRDSFAHEPLMETVSESPAFAARRKMVLVESRRERATEEAIERVLAVNEGRWRERLEIYDWRILESCMEHAIGPAEVKRHLMGATMFDESRQRPIFVGNGL